MCGIGNIGDTTTTKKNTRSIWRESKEKKKIDRKQIERNAVIPKDRRQVQKIYLKIFTYRHDVMDDMFVVLVDFVPSDENRAKEFAINVGNDANQCDRMIRMRCFDD